MGSELVCESDEHIIYYINRNGDEIDVCETRIKDGVAVNKELDKDKHEHIIYYTNRNGDKIETWCGYAQYDKFK